MNTKTELDYIDLLNIKVCIGLAIENYHNILLKLELSDKTNTSYYKAVKKECETYENLHDKIIKMMSEV